MTRSAQQLANFGGVRSWHAYALRRQSTFAPVGPMQGKADYSGRNSLRSVGSVRKNRQLSEERHALLHQRHRQLISLDDTAEPERFDAFNDWICDGWAPMFAATAKEFTPVCTERAGSRGRPQVSRSAVPQLQDHHASDCWPVLDASTTAGAPTSAKATGNAVNYRLTCARGLNAVKPDDMGPGYAGDTCAAACPRRCWQRGRALGCS